jgi:16S rRNA (guanine(966)-N(2))-methyltransferase RsmD
MRVVAGSAGGRTLRAPKGSATRPTSDRVREALFSILESLAPDVSGERAGERGGVAGRRVLDLFAGSGALAIEALSRGARAATLVDVSPSAIAAIRANLDDLALEAEVVRRPALAFLATARAGARQYDLVFVDPPYRLASELGPRLSGALHDVLAPGATVVVECDRRAPLNLELPLLTQRRYGDTVIRIHGSR